MPFCKANSTNLPLRRKSFDTSGKLKTSVTVNQTKKSENRFTSNPNQLEKITWTWQKGFVLVRGFVPFVIYTVWWLSWGALKIPIKGSVETKYIFNMCTKTQRNARIILAQPALSPQSCVNAGERSDCTSYYSALGEKHSHLFVFL